MTLRNLSSNEIPKVGTFEREQLRGAAAKSNEVLHQLGPDIQWVESYVVDDKTFCVYLAKDEKIIHEHARISGFPATKITEVKKLIDPKTAAPGASAIRASGFHSRRPTSPTRSSFSTETARPAVPVDVKRGLTR